MRRRITVLAIYCLAVVGYAMAQSNPQNAPASGQAASQPAPQAGAATTPENAPADAQAKPKNDDPADAKNSKTSTTAAPTNAPNHTPVSRGQGSIGLKDLRCAHGRL